MTGRRLQGIKLLLTCAHQPDEMHCAHMGTSWGPLPSEELLPSSAALDDWQAPALRIAWPDAMGEGGCMVKHTCLQPASRCLHRVQWGCMKCLNGVLAWSA